MTNSIQTLYEHQLRCKHEIATLFSKPNIDHRALIKMFCGSGKSYIIYDTILAFGHKLSVIVVPSIGLITQFNKDYLLDPIKISYNKHNYNKSFNVMTICSKDEVKDTNTENTFTTNDDIIEKSLNNFISKDKNVVVLVTYQSLGKLINIIRQNNMKIDLMCFDEAHHILGMNMKKQLFGTDEADYSDTNEVGEVAEVVEVFEVIEKSKSDENLEDDENIDDENIDDENIDDENNSNSEYKTDENFLTNYVDKVLFFTATPKNTNNIVMYEPHAIVINDVECIIEDDINTEVADEPHCGPMIFEYMHIDGVKDDRLNDFKIRVDMYTKDNNGSVFEAISRTILETGNNRVLTFHSRSETSSETGTNVIDFTSATNKDEFLKCFKRILNKEFPQHKTKYKPSEIELVGITAKTKDRQGILKAFEKTPNNKICVLSSCKTIGEGIDTKNANMVVFVDPKQSYVEIIQNIGRICRKQDNLSTVLIPAYIDVNKYKDCDSEEDIDRVIRQEMSKTGDFNGILNVLSALRQEDPYLFELCLKYPETYTKKEIEQNLKNNGLKLGSIEYSSSELFDKYKIKYNKTKTEAENFTKLSKVIKKNIQITNDKVLEEDIFIEYVEKSADIIIQSEYFVKTADKYQTTTNKDNVIKIPKPNRNIKPIIHTNDEIKVLWKVTSDTNLNKKIYGGYIEATIKPGTQEYWFEMLNSVKQYIDKNKKRPTMHDKNPKIKTMGYWINNHNHAYKRNIHVMKDKKIRKHWEKFIDDYKQYFLSVEEIWEDKLSKVKKYLNQNKKKPSGSDKDSKIKTLGTWISIQQQNYKKNGSIISNKNIYDKWKEFIYSETYSEYFLSDVKKWNIKLDELKSYINQNDALPYKMDKNNKIKFLGAWINTQENNYKKKINIMNNSEIYNRWNKFINDPLYLKYFMSNIEEWYVKINDVKEYIINHNKRPTKHDKNIKIKKLGGWIINQQTNYKKKKHIMSNPEIYTQWKEFINSKTYSKYFNNIIDSDTDSETIQKTPISDTDSNLGIVAKAKISPTQIPSPDKIHPKSTTLKPKSDPIPNPTQIIPNDLINKKSTLTKSKYQELTKKMSTQKSQNTQKMFKDDPNLWEEYHAARDQSFKGYDKQEEIPINKIISKLETKIKYKLKILDLGCGRNLIKQYYKSKSNTNFNIIGYDYVENNGSKIADISNLVAEDDDQVDICIYSQSLMGSNWKDYLVEGKRVLRYNGEMIISESVERFDIIREYLADLDMKIINTEYNETNRWFYIYAIKQ